jgi:hypothetical protein
MRREKKAVGELSLECIEPNAAGIGGEDGVCVAQRECQHSVVHRFDN